MTANVSAGAAGASDVAVNRLLLAACVVERGARRSTPAGLPALDLRLAHQGSHAEDGRMRQVSLEIRAIGIGAICGAIEALALGATARFAGFLAATRNGRGLLFHITAVDPG